MTLECWGVRIHKYVCIVNIALSYLNYKEQKKIELKITMNDQPLS